MFIDLLFDFFLTCYSKFLLTFYSVPAFVGNGIQDACGVALSTKHIRTYGKLRKYS